MTRVVFDVLPHEESEYEVVSGPYSSELVLRVVLRKAFFDDEYGAKLGLKFFDPISARRDAAGYWWIVGKPLPDGTIAVAGGPGTNVQHRSVMHW